MLTSIPVSYIIARIGFKHSLVVSYIFYLPALLAFQFVERGMLPLDFNLIMVSGFLLALGKAFHWISLHSEFAVDSSQDDRDSDSGKLLGLPKISKALAPFAGGIIMATFGFGGLITTSVLFLVLSSLPLMASGDHRDPEPYSLKAIATKKHLRYSFLFYLRGLGISAGFFMFPLFMALVISKGPGAEVDAGIVSSLASIGIAGFTILLGKKSESIGRSKMILTGTLLSGAFFIARGLVQTSFQAFAVSLAAGPAYILYYLPIYSKLADAAEDEDVLEFYAFREVILGISKVSFYLLILYLFFNYGLETAFRTGFYVTGFATAMIFLADRVVQK